MLYHRAGEHTNNGNLTPNAHRCFTTIATGGVNNKQETQQTLTTTQFTARQPNDTARSSQVKYDHDTQIQTLTHVHNQTAHDNQRQHNLATHTHTYIQTDIHTYIHTYIHTDTHTYRASLGSSLYSGGLKGAVSDGRRRRGSAGGDTGLSAHSDVSSGRAPVVPDEGAALGHTYASIHTLTLTHSLTHSFTHSPTHTLTPRDTPEVAF